MSEEQEALKTRIAKARDLLASGELPAEKQQAVKKLMGELLDKYDSISSQQAPAPQQAPQQVQQQQPQPQPGMMQRGVDAMRGMVNPPREDIPEMPYIYQGNPQSALELYQRKDPTAQLTEDAQGNPVIEGQAGRQYPDRPGFTARDIPQGISDATDFAQRMAPAVAGGQAAAPMGAIRGTATAAGAGAVSEGAYVGAESGNPQKAGYAALRGALYDSLGEVGGRTLARVLSPIIKMVNKRMRPVTMVGRDGQITDQGIEMLERVSKQPELLNRYEREIARLVDDGTLTAEQAQRYNTFLRRGVEPVEAQVTRDASQFMDMEEAAKNSGPLRARLEGQEVALRDSMEGAVPRPPERVDPYDFVVDRVNQADSVVDDLYRQVREMSFDDPAIVPEQFLDAVRGSLSEDGITNGMVRGLRGQLRNMGVDLQGGQARLTAGQAEEIRKYLNKLGTSTTPRGQMLIKGFKDALDEDVAKYAGEDVYAPARTAKADLEGSLNRARRNRRDQRSGDGLLRDVVNNKIGPDEFVDKLRTKRYRASDIAEYRDFLMQSGDDGMQAWEGLRRDVLDDIVENTFKGPENSVGVRAPTRNRMERALRPWEDKLPALFEADELSLLSDVQEILRYRERPPNYGVGKGPSAQAIMDQTAEVISSVKGLGPGAARLVRGFFRGGKEELAVQRALRDLEKDFTEKNLNAMRRALFSYVRPAGQPAGAAAGVIQEEQ